MAKKQVSPMVEEYERSMRSFDAQPKWLQEASLRYMRSIPHLKRSACHSHEPSTNGNGAIRKRNRSNETHSP